jgi:ATP sulfurylase
MSWLAPLLRSKLSGTKFRQLLRSGAEIPEWFAFPSVVSVLRRHVQQPACT